MKKTSTSLRRHFFTLACLVLAGCAAPAAAPEPEPAPPPTLLKLNIQASDRLNPDIEGRASPLVIRLYQLASVDVFNGADFFAVYENDLSVLANDTKFRRELEIKPGERIALTQEGAPGARYFAVFAAFRDLDVAQWRAFIPLPAQQTTTATVSIDSTSLSIDVEAPAPPP